MGFLYTFKDNRDGFGRKILKFHPFCAIKNFVVYEVATVKSFLTLLKDGKGYKCFSTAVNGRRIDNIGEAQYLCCVTRYVQLGRDTSYPTHPYLCNKVIWISRSTVWCAAAVKTLRHASAWHYELKSCRLAVKWLDASRSNASRSPSNLPINVQQLCCDLYALILESKRLQKSSLHQNI